MLIRRVDSLLCAFSVFALLCLHVCFARAAEVAEPAQAESATVSPTERLRIGLRAYEPIDRLRAIDAVPVEDLAPDQRKEVVDLLVEALDDDIPDIRALAADTIGRFGDDAKHTIPRLLQQAGDQGVTSGLRGVWISVSKALSSIGPAALQPMLEAIPKSDRITYYSIAGAIAEWGEHPEYAEHARSTAPVLIERLRIGPENRRWATMFALSKLDNAAAPAIPDFIDQLDHENFNMQVMACRALASQGPAAKAAVPKLLRLIDEGILSSRTHAAMCLGAIGPVDGVDSVAILSEMALEKNAFSQERAMIALGRLGSHAKDAGELIEQLIEQDDFSPKPEAAKALWLVSGESQRALDVLKSVIDSPTYDFRVMAVLEEMGPEASPLVDVVAQKLDDEDQGVRLDAVRTLESIGPAAAPYLDALRKHLPDSDRDVVKAINDAIDEISVYVSQ